MRTAPHSVLALTAGATALVNHLRRLARPKGPLPQGTTIRHRDGRRYRVDQHGHWRLIAKPLKPNRRRKAERARANALA